MSNNVTGELLAMVIRIGAIAAILGAFYATVGMGGTAQTLAIGAAAAFGSQAAAFTVRRVSGDRRAKPLLIVIFTALAIAATLYVVLTAPDPSKPVPSGVK